MSKKKSRQHPIIECAFSDDCPEVLFWEICRQQSLRLLRMTRTYPRYSWVTFDVTVETPRQMRPKKSARL